MKFVKLLMAVCLAGVPFVAEGQDKTADGCRIIYVPTEETVVEKMLDMAKVVKTDVVFDLGCGDGRIVCLAAKKFGAKRGVGVDYDPARVKDCMVTMKKYGVTKEQVDIRQGDALKVKDLERASVIMLYMLPEFMEKLEPQLAKLKPGTRIVAHDYPFPNMKADQIVEFKGPGRDHTLYMWTIKKKE